MKSIDDPTNVRDIQNVLGLVNYYRDMWRKRAHTLASLTYICSTEVNFKWTDVEKNYFIAMKKIVGRDVLLYYLNFSKRFIVHTGARKTQLGGVISQNGKPTAF